MDPSRSGQGLSVSKRAILVLAVVLLTGCGESEKPSPPAVAQAPKPVITGVDPPGTRARKDFNVQATGRSGLSVLGSNFNARSVIVADGRKLTTVFGNPGWITAELPAELYAAPHNVAIKVVNADGSESAPFDFKVEAAGK